MASINTPKYNLETMLIKDNSFIDKYCTILLSIYTLNSPQKSSYIILKFLKLQDFHLTSCLPAIRSGYLGVWLQNFYTTKVITSDLQNCCSDKCTMALPFIIYSPSNCLQKVRNLQIVLINLYKAPQLQKWAWNVRIKL